MGTSVFRLGRFDLLLLTPATRRPVGGRLSGFEPARYLVRGRVLLRHIPLSGASPLSLTRARVPVGGCPLEVRASPAREGPGGLIL